jgi:hypothetical protein
VYTIAGVTFHIVTCISVAREQLGKHVPAKKNSWPTIGKLLFIARQRAVNKFRQQCRPCLLCVPCRAHIRSSEDSSKRFTATERKVSNLRQQNMVASTKGLGPEKDCAGKGQHHLHKTDPSSRQRGRPQNNKTVIVKQ